IGDRLPAMHFRLVGVLRLADVQDGPDAGRRLRQDAAKVKPILDARVVGARVALLARTLLRVRRDQIDGHDGSAGCDQEEGRPESFEEPSHLLFAPSRPTRSYQVSGRAGPT